MKKALLVTFLVVSGLAALTLATSWSELSRLDYARLPTRATWQLPARVVESLELEPGDRVADIGAGDGYFTFRLADAVGPAGRVYAVEVEEGKVRRLEEKVRTRGYSNVEVVLGQYDDPLLPDVSIDLMFLCNTYHHIDDRREYFSRLRAGLRDGGRVANVDMRDKLTGLAGLLSHPGHSTVREILHHEMRAAGYRLERSFDYLPVQSFEIFSMSK